MERKGGILLATGILGVAVSGTVSFIFQNIWAGYFTAILVGIICLIFLDRTVVKHLETSGYKRLIRIIVGCMVLAQLYASYLFYKRSNLQYENLAEIRLTLEESVSKIRTHEALFEALRHYYQDDGRTDKTIAFSFREVMGSKLMSDGTVELEDPRFESEIDYSYEIPFPDSVVIIYSSQIAEGVDPDFANLNSKTGRYQGKAILTPEGISYEREN